MSNEERIAVLKRTIVCMTRPPTHMTDQMREDLAVLEEMITELGGDTRNDLRAIKLEDCGHEFGDDPDYTGEG